MLDAALAAPIIAAPEEIFLNINKRLNYKIINQIKKERKRYEEKEHF